MTKSKKVDLILLIIYPFSASITAFLFNINFFFSVLVFLGVPSVFLSLRAKEYVGHTLIFSLILAIPFAIILNYISHITNTWLIRYSILSIRLFGYVTIDVIIWSVFLVYFPIMFYRYFFAETVPSKLYVRNTTSLIILLVFLMFIFLILLVFSPNYLQIPYFYLLYGTVFELIPLSIVCFLFSKIRYPFIMTGFYFSVFNLLYEITAVKLRMLEFPSEGKFVGWVSFLGISLPFEEFFFWIILGAPTILSWFVLFGEERKKFFGTEA